VQKEWREKVVLRKKKMKEKVTAMDEGKNVFSIKAN